MNIKFGISEDFEEKDREIKKLRKELDEKPT